MLRSLPRRLPRATRYPSAIRSLSTISALQAPKRAYATATETKAVPPSPADSFANGANSHYIEE